MSHFDVPLAAAVIVIVIVVVKRELCHTITVTEKTADAGAGGKHYFVFPSSVDGLMKG